MRRLVFDLETTGLPRGRDKPPTDLEAYADARVLQIAYVVCDEGWNPVSDAVSRIVRPDGFLVRGVEIHGITPERAYAEGVPFDTAVEGFFQELAAADFVYAHNASFDVPVLASELHRRAQPQLGQALADAGGRIRCTMLASIAAVGARNAYGRPKWPTLAQLYARAMGPNAAMPKAHDAKWYCLNLCEALCALRAEGLLMDL